MIELLLMTELIDRLERNGSRELKACVNGLMWRIVAIIHQDEDTAQVFLAHLKFAVEAAERQNRERNIEAAK